MISLKPSAAHRDELLNFLSDEEMRTVATDARVKLRGNLGAVLRDARSPSFEDILEQFPAPRLQEICRAWRLPPHGSRTVLARKLMEYLEAIEMRGPGEEARLVENARTGSPKRAKAHISLFSTKYSARGGEDALPLTVDELKASISAARSISIASAYYDKGFLANLFAGHGRRTPQTPVRLILNGLGGLRLKEQVTHLRGVIRSARKGGFKLEARLKFEPGIFHSKLFITSGPKGASYVGSANATGAAFEKNEEILIRVETASSVLEDYFDGIWSTAVSLDDAEARSIPDNLVKFYRTGLIYFKPTTYLPRTFNPFSDLIARLTPAELRRLGASGSPWEDEVAGIGAFNVERAVGLAGGSKGGTVKFSVKPYAVETCLGYWVPRALQKELDRSLKKAADHKEGGLDRLLAHIDKTTFKKVRQRYEEYKQSARDRLVAARIDIHRQDDGHFRDPFSAGSDRAFDGFLTRTHENLKDERFRERACRPLVASLMPEIWDDPPVVQEFERTFFEYIQYVMTSSGRKHRVPAKIAERIGYAGRGESGGARWEGLKVGLRESLYNYPWKPTEWLNRKAKTGRRATGRAEP